MRYRYTGPAPIEIQDSGVLVHPRDVWEFPEPPAFGQWEPAGGSETAAETPATQTPAGDADSAPTDTSAPASKES